MKGKLAERAKRLKTDIPALLFALGHKRTPWYARAVAAIAVAYALSPVDLIPDFIPLLGYLDDLLILPALVALFIRLVPQDVMEECRAEAEKRSMGKPAKKWYFALPIILLWCVILAAAAMAVYRRIKA